jgi:hypothetical protein
MKRSLRKVAIQFQEWLDGLADLGARREHFEFVFFYSDLVTLNLTAEHPRRDGLTKIRFLKPCR